MEIEKCEGGTFEFFGRDVWERVSGGLPGRACEGGRRPAAHVLV